MPNKQLVVIGIVICLLISSCSKRQVPDHSTAMVTNNSTTPAKKPVKKATPQPVPKVIVVNDKAAKKSFDGRLYYDINGRRYWRNYNDGKYYLFDNAMYADSAFRPH